MNKDIETLREAADFIDYDIEVCRVTIADKLRAIADRMENQEPVGDCECKTHSCPECKSKQAKIDALMLEYCPEEMTQEQKDEWAKHQKPVQQPATRTRINHDTNRQIEELIREATGLLYGASEISHADLIWRMEAALRTLQKRNDELAVQKVMQDVQRHMARSQGEGS